MIYELSKENVDLAREEVLALCENKEFEIIKNFLICEEVDYKRLAFTNNVFENIFVSDKIEDIDWEKYYTGDFCIRCNITSKEKELAKIVWNSLKEPKVKLRGSKSEFHFFYVQDKIICGRKIYQREEKFHLRRPDLRPGFFPVSLKPKLARALVNLAGVKKGKIWDPFCGTGGILIEAALVGLEVEGSDVDELMIRAAKDNFKKYNIDCKLEVKDSRKAKVECDAIVTDPPYGRRASLKKVVIENLYEDFLKNVYEFVDTVVLMIPNNLEVKTKYKVMFETEDYVHASLTRRIVVLNK
ncbi:methyltransferase [archaeon]|nr:methyltransferase [archaeon]MBT7280853.1 methyltransferase [archaeon]